MARPRHMAADSQPVRKPCAMTGHPPHSSFEIVSSALLSGVLGPLIPFDEADYRIEIDGFPPLNVRCAP